MASIRWNQVFSTCYPVAGASEDELESLAQSLATPLTEDEIARINDSQSNPFRASHPLHCFYKPIDARLWRLPVRPLPPCYLAFLHWSNGGSFFTANRRFDPFFAASEVRHYLLGYHLPHYMPGAVPFAFDGGGQFYLFDMREQPVAGEYPILFVRSGNLSYNDSVHVATSFIDACRGADDPTDRYMR